jgi:hypothetical protein
MYRLSILVSVDVSQLIQKIIGIGWITSTDTINHIFVIGCTMSVDPNSVSGIKGVTQRCETLIAMNFFCAVRLPNFPVLYVVASLDAASLGASVASLDATPSPLSTSPLSLMPHRRQPCRTIAIVIPDPSPTPSRHAITNPVTPSPSPFLTHRQPHHAMPSPFPRLEPRCQAGFHWLMVAAFWKMQGGSFFRGF